MASSAILRHVALERTDVSEERITSIISVIVFLHSVLRLLFTDNIVSSSAIFVTLMMEALRSFE
jgi:hypothetical protein